MIEWIEIAAAETFAEVDACRMSASKPIEAIALALSQAYSRGLEDAARVVLEHRCRSCGGLGSAEHTNFGSCNIDMATKREISDEIRQVGSK